MNSFEDKTNLQRKAEDIIALRGFRDDRPFAFAPAGEINGVSFINDSASVSIEQTAAALADVSAPVIWIVEANGKHGDLSLLGDLVKNHVKAIVAVGSAAYEVHDALWKATKFFTAASSWDEALDLSLIIATDGDTVLFSPACRTVEPFGNYRERGTYFNELITIRKS